jgi:acyl dehydratase
MAVERFPVESGHILMFAEAIGDPNPVYRDPEVARAQGFEDVLAPPTFAQASAHLDPGYILRPTIGAPWFGSGREATGTPSSGGGGGGTGLHAEQHFEYARPLRAGDVLTATVRPGKAWEKEGRRAGVMKFTETITEYRDQNGELVVTARGVGVVTSRPVEQEEGQ